MNNEPPPRMHFEGNEMGNNEFNWSGLSITQDNTIAGNVPCEKSHVIWYFIEHNGGKL